MPQIHNIQVFITANLMCLVSIRIQKRNGFGLPKIIANIQHPSDNFTSTTNLILHDLPCILNNYDSQKKKIPKCYTPKICEILSE